MLDTNVILKNIVRWRREKRLPIQGKVSRQAIKETVETQSIKQFNAQINHGKTFATDAFKSI